MKGGTPKRGNVAPESIQKGSLSADKRQRVMSNSSVFSDVIIAEELGSATVPENSE